MKAITIHQPWASLIAIGAKRFETRSWKTNYRGPIAIHASKTDPHDMIRSLPHDVQRAMYEQFYDRLGISSGALKRMPTGSIVATAELSDCLKSVDTWTDGYELEGRKLIYSPEYEFGDFTPGRFTWELTNVRMLDDPIPAKGQQGLWNWNPD
ncbi:ASCH domain-containing protein [Paenibacillus validus]|uniref:ASCH domain-containing protein n=1 Tax=Paenibacillus TaxID=44249 RepID=UPI000FDB019A|nr:MULTISPECIES: ASCH domain-containing protein [Paenibacillus]MED4600107.1 ASCH domain-containing protein [Paenibacillus validus]MED4605555.1 ASCH domain-containing protein [Paenibacillus validus]